MCRAVDIFQNLCRANAIRAVNIFLSISETARNTRTADDFSLFLIFEQLTRKNIIARMVLSNNKIMLSRFFEQSNFEQMIMTQNWLQMLNLTFRTIILDLIQMKTWLQLNHQFVSKIEDCIEIIKLNQKFVKHNCRLH